MTTYPSADWQTAAVAPMLKELYKGTSLGRTGSVLTIHNLAFQVGSGQVHMYRLAVPHDAQLILCSVACPDNQVLVTPGSLLLKAAGNVCCLSRAARTPTCWSWLALSARQCTHLTSCRMSCTSG